MKALVTGATGFIGGNLARELLGQGFQVRALVREESNRKNIDDLDIETALGDLTDRASLDRALDGCDVLFHVAAAYTFWARDPGSIYKSNVQGTENILAAALDRGIEKVVYTSTESTIGIDRGENLGTEEMEVNPRGLAGDYRKSKYKAERLAFEMCQQGLPLVVVNPTVPIGPLDIKPTPTGKLVVSYLNRNMPAYVNTGLNVIDVEDVAKGHVLALEKGRVGERYILGNKNLTFSEILGILEKITGIKAPRLRIPIWFALGMAYIDEFIEAGLIRKQPSLQVAGVKSATKFRQFDCSKSVRELGLPQTPVEEAFEKAVRWFRENGYAA
ncbi:hopanoid-associated sugar epimerase [Chloroflexota bacterium]